MQGEQINLSAAVCDFSQYSNVSLQVAREGGGCDNVAVSHDGFGVRYTVGEMHVEFDAYM